MLTVVLLVALALALLSLGGFVLHALSRRRDFEAEAADLRLQARVDGLTTLGNRHAFEEDVDTELLRAGRSGQALSLVVLSLDREPWKEQTDDAQRRALAQAMSLGVRSVDVGYRIGTDEFALILPYTRARGGLVAATGVERALLAAGAPPESITAGVAEGGPGIDRRELFRNAYVALLAAGREGRRNVLVYSPELEPTATMNWPVGLTSEFEAGDGTAM